MIAEIFLPEFDYEMPLTRNVLARVPDASAAWRPHPKSMSLGELAHHVVSLISSGVRIVRETGSDRPASGGPGIGPKPFTKAARMLREFDDGVAATRAAVAEASDSSLMETWSYQVAGKTLFAAPRASVLRGFLMNHVIHHRGQLSVYLRLLDVPLPPIYGPTADEAAHP